MVKTKVDGRLRTTMAEPVKAVSTDGPRSRLAAYAVASAMLALVLLQALTAMAPPFAPDGAAAQHVPPAAVLNLVRSI